MKLVRKYPILGSSSDPEKVGLTIKGLIVAAIPLFIMIAQRYDVDITETEVMELIESVTLLISVLTVIVGLARKFILKIKNLRKQ